MKMNFLENITFRRTRTRSENSELNESDIISQTLNYTSNSMPGVPEDDETVQQLKIVKDRIEELSLQLNSAHNEIENLSLENNKLKQINEDLMKKNEMFKKIACTPVKHKATPKKNTKKNNNKSENTPTYKIQPVSQDSNCTDKSVCAQKLCHTKIPDTSSPALIASTKQKICFISSEASNRLNTLIERTLLCNLEVCHYRTPNCGIEYILSNINGKVRDLTKSDYCVIYIGEEDFRRTQNYRNLVMSIHEYLIPFNHTNFIICLPTYKYMNNTNVMFNSRVEAFNNLLFMDAETYKYAFILDTNLNLPFTIDTYSQRLGTLNYKGQEIIMSDLKDLIHDLTVLNAVYIEVDNFQKQQQNSESDSETQNLFYTIDSQTTSDIHSSVNHSFRD